MSTEADPYADFKDDGIPGNLETVLIQLADELEAADALIERLEAQLEEAKDARKEIAEQRIPNATEGMDGELHLKDGRKLLVKEEIRCSIAGDKAAPAIKWVTDNDYGHIVKRQKIFEFGKDSDEQVNAFMKAVTKYQAEKGAVLNIKDKDSIHHQTLLAWVKEQLAEGVDLPRDTFGIFRQRVAKVKS